jgi:hypothetical protein
MESIFLLLSGAIVLAGVLYWFWSHIQLTQKKVQLLENAVFELRGMVTGPGPGPGPGPTPSGPSGPSGASAGPGPAAPAYNDLSDDDWEEPEEKRDEVRTISTPLEDLGSNSDSSSGSGPVLVTREVEEVPEDLQPGGRLLVPTEEEFVEQESFRELFVSRELPPPANSPAGPSGRAQESLDSMPVKELRRLAEQRGIANAADMRKKEILAALRNQITNTVTIEKALDLTKVEEETEGDIAADVEAVDEGTVEAEILE